MCATDPSSVVLISVKIPHSTVGKKKQKQLNKWAVWMNSYDVMKGILIVLSGACLWTAWYPPSFVVGFVQQIAYFSHPLLNNLDRQYCTNRIAALRHLASCLSRMIFVCFSPGSVAFHQLNGFIWSLLFADLRLLLLHLEPEKLTVLHWPFWGSQRYPKWIYSLSGRWDADF